MAENYVFDESIELNSGHDCVRVSAIGNYQDAVQMEFSGRDPTVVSITLHQIRDVRALAKALIAAADAVEASDK